jgi:hypothetical protein
MKMPKYNTTERIGSSLSKQGAWWQASLVLAFVLASMVTSCGPDTGKMTPLLPNGVADLVIVYRKETTDEQIEDFLNNVLAHRRPDVRGHEFLPAIGLVARESDIPGYKATDIKYRSDAPQWQRDEVKRAALSSPIVYKVLEDVAPSKIKKIE